MNSPKILISLFQTKKSTEQRLTDKYVGKETQYRTTCCLCYQPQIMSLTNRNSATLFISYTPPKTRNFIDETLTFIYFLIHGDQNMIKKMENKKNKM